MEDHKMVIKSNRGSLVWSTSSYVVLRGTDSPDHEIVRHVEKGRSLEKRYRFKGLGRTYPFYPAQSFAIHRGSVYKRTNL
ncbi:hypothetical protein ACS0PU_001402 [Formica fusca]